MDGMKKHMSVAAAVLLGTAAFCGDSLSPLASGDVALNGGLARYMERSKAGWILGDVPYHEFARFFRDGRPKFATGEMWGKFVRAGCMFYRYAHDEAIKARMKECVADILAAERSNGSISCTPAEAQPDGRGGDLWERKYVMLGLEGYYSDVERDPAVLESLKRQADAIIAQVGPPPKVDVRDQGWSPNHVESSTLLEPFMRLYSLSRERRYLDFAKDLVDCGGAKGSDLVQMAFDKVPPHLMAGAYPKAYETTSYFEGLADYWRATGDERVRRAVLNYFELVRDRELTIVGNGGADQPFHPRVFGEAWSDTAREQTNPDIKRMMETCTGVTWMKFCSHILRMTGDCSAAEAIEKYVYNGLVGAMKPDGKGFSYVNLLDGEKVTNKGWGWDFGGKRVTCCNLNGPMGLAYIPYVSVMQAADGLALNIYNAMCAKANAPSGAAVEMTVETDYPLSGHVRIVLSPTAAEEFALRLRIPAWSTETDVRLNGSAYGEKPESGRYLEMRRMWRKGDVVELDFDMRCRLLKGPSGVNQAGDDRVAVAYGPIVLTRDEDVDKRYNEPVHIVASADGTIQARRIEPAPNGAQVAFAVPTVEGTIVMTDYASADCWDGSHVRTWLSERLVSRRER